MRNIKNGYYILIFVKGKHFANFAKKKLKNSNFAQKAGADEYIK